MVGSRQLHEDCARSGVTHRVGQSFLRHPKQAHGDVKAQRIEVASRAERHRELVEPFHVCAVTAQRRNQARVPRARLDAARREVLDRFCERRRAVLQRCHSLNVLRLRARPADVALQNTQHDPDTSELLAEVVVQLPRNTRSLCFLSVDQAAGKVLILLDGDPEPSLALSQRHFGSAPPRTLDEQQR